jgi:hypothetical protein
MHVSSYPPAPEVNIPLASGILRTLWSHHKPGAVLPLLSLYGCAVLVVLV